MEKDRHAISDKHKEELLPAKIDLRVLGRRAYSKEMFRNSVAKLFLEGKEE